VKDRNNWVIEVLDNVSSSVEAWPEWMRRPEMQSPDGRQVRQGGDVSEDARNLRQS
jgi:hypothetical protein